MASKAAIGPRIIVCFVLSSVSYVKEDKKVLGVPQATKIIVSRKLPGNKTLVNALITSTYGLPILLKIIALTVIIPVAIPEAEE